MRILVLSDLHLEYGPFEPPKTGHDLVILAGDIHPRLVGVRWAMDKFPSVPVLYVAGNHEFYGEKHPRLFEKMKALAAGSNVHILENEGVELYGFRFFGATLWTDFALTGDVDAAFEEAKRMNDFTRVRHWPTLKKFQPTHARLAHMKTLDAMKAYLNAGDASHTVVITHHAPSMHSVQEEDQKRPISAAYASNLNDFILAHQPALWIHGHLHRHQDYTLGRTRVLANPRGYLGHDAEKSSFIPDLTVSL